MDEDGVVASSQKLTITMKSYNRYIDFQGYKERFNLCLYKSGDIDLKMKEFCHGDYLERIYAWIIKLFEGLPSVFRV